MSAITASAFRCVPHSQGECHPVMGDPMRFIMTAEHTGGAYAISEVQARPGNGAPPHIHRHEEEAFYVLEGTFRIEIDGREMHAQPGDFVHVPRGAVRSFTNIGPAPARLLILHTPGAAAGFYIGMGKLPFPPAIEDITALGNQYGIEVVRPAT